MDEKQLKDIGLYRDQIALKPKYYPIYFEF